MALSDAELLALLARAEEGRKGDKGEKGVGIESVNSPEPGKLVINLDDGSRYNFQFPTLKGEQGDKGPRGDAGVGSPGPQGAKGDSGRDGIDGVGIDSALVSGGNLLIGLTNGRAIDAGRVAGPAGPAGAPGADGIGRPGADGRDGRDGAQILTGSGKPDGDLGNPGDLYLDVLSEGLSLYQKTSADGWSFVAELRPIGERARYMRKGMNNPTGGGVSGGGGAAGGGGAVIIKPGPIPPTQDNDGNKVNNGDLWYDPTNGWYYIYVGEWILLGGDGPALISDDPPEFDRSDKHPVQEGSIWFDSDQLATYIAVKNSSDELVWVIATPHNREGLASEIDTVNIPIFAFPRATDKQIEYNPTTDTEYIYNAAKNQWIDLSQMVHYGTRPPAHAPTGAVFTDEESLKQFIQISQGVWVEQTSCGAGPGGTISGNLTAVKFTGYRTRIYAGFGPTEKSLLSEVYWETQQGIHFEDEYLVEVDMLGNGNWEDAHALTDAEKGAYDIGMVFVAHTGAIAFNFDWKGTNDGPWDPQANYPCAQMRVTVTNKNLLDSGDVTVKTSEPMFVFPEYKQDPKLETPTPAHPGASC